MLAPKFLSISIWLHYFSLSGKSEMKRENGLGAVLWKAKSIELPYELTIPLLGVYFTQTISGP